MALRQAKADGAVAVEGLFFCPLCLFDIERLAMPALCVSQVADVPTFSPLSQ